MPREEERPAIARRQDDGPPPELPGALDEPVDERAVLLVLDDRAPDVAGEAQRIRGVEHERVDVDALPTERTHGRETGHLVAQHDGRGACRRHGPIIVFFGVPTED